MAVINIRGDIVGNDDKWIYDWFGMEATCPKDVKDILQTAAQDEACLLYTSVPELRIGRKYRDMTGGEAGGEAHSGTIYRHEGGRT